MIDVSKVSSDEREAILARRAYFADWRAKNRDKVRKSNFDYWKKRRQNANAVKTKGNEE